MAENLVQAACRQVFNAVILLGNPVMTMRAYRHMAFAYIHQIGRENTLAVAAINIGSKGSSFQMLTPIIPSVAVALAGRVRPQCLAQTR
jgi:hypothetical protein